MTHQDGIAFIQQSIQLDLAMQDLAKADLRPLLEDLRQETTRDGVLLAAMRLFAKAANGHTRIIPNAAVQVAPVRIVCLGKDYYIIGGAKRDLIGGALVSVNGVGVHALEERFSPFLAGTAQRRRVIGGFMFAWPEALVRVGAGEGRTINYEVRLGDEVKEASLSADTLGVDLYPVSETGFCGPNVDPYEAKNLADILHLRLPTCLQPIVDRDVSKAVQKLRADPGKNVILDCRGNPGGDFTRVLPLLEQLREGWRGEKAVMLVDKFTFSAAIVVAVLAKHHLGDRICLMGEEMGDDLQFFAEGSSVDIPWCGGQLRYSNGYHDWQGGVAHPSISEDIKRHLVGVGQLRIEHAICPTGADLLEGRDPVLDQACEKLRG